MGTNYYIRLPGCEHPCDHCAKAAEIHLGKSSGGWRFLHRAYRQERDIPAGLDFLVTDRATWLKLLDLGPIFDEYGREHDRTEFLARIDGKQDGIAHNSAKARELCGPHYDLRRDSDFVSNGYDFCDGEFS